MYQPNRSRIKRIGVDILGFLCIIGAALTGWLPGPGGIPLLILGLSLLATNHHWAERILLRVKDGGSKVAERIFEGSRTQQWIVDAIGILLIAVAVLVLTTVTRNIKYTVIVSLTVLAIVLLLGNQKRWHRITRKKRI